jgi:NADH-quinone oxidoreductase subunit J
MISCSLLPMFAAAYPAKTMWAITVPVVLGGLAVFVLLPRPRRFPPLAGAACAGLALLFAGWLLVDTGTSGPETVLFYSFSGIAIVGGGLLVTQANPVKAALSFTLVVLSTCGLFLLLAAPFLMAATIIVYAGAIIVTFLFVIMLAQQSGLSDADQRSREPLLTTVGGFVLLGALLFILAVTYDSSGIERHVRRTEAVLERLSALPPDGDWRGPSSDVESTLKDFLEWQSQTVRSGTDASKRLEAALIDAASTGASPQATRTDVVQALNNVRDRATEVRWTMGFLRPGANARLSDASGPPPNLPPGELRRDAFGRPPLPAANTAYLGRSLFSDYLLAVELGGTLLLIATIGAIAITGRRTERPR